VTAAVHRAILRRLSLAKLHPCATHRPPFIAILRPRYRSCLLHWARPVRPDAWMRAQCSRRPHCGLARVPRPRGNLPIPSLLWSFPFFRSNPVQRTNFLQARHYCRNIFGDLRWYSLNSTRLKLWRATLGRKTEEPSRA
jgi:hypothetical protein